MIDQEHDESDVDDDDDGSSKEYMFNLFYIFQKNIETIISLLAWGPVGTIILYKWLFLVILLRLIIL